MLTPLATGPGQPFPYISALSLSLVLLVREAEGGEERIARVKVPEGLPRFVSVGSRGVFIALEDVIAHFAPRLFPQMEIVEQAFFRVTRDADYEISDEADDLRVAVELELRRRRFGEVVRIEVSSGISPRLREWLESGLRVDGDQVYLAEGLLDRGALMQLVALDRPELKDEPWPGVTNARFRDVKPTLTSFGRSPRATSSSTIRTSPSPRASAAFSLRPRTPTSSGSRRPCTGRTTSRRSCPR